MYINAEWFKFQRDKIHEVYVSMAISHSVWHVTTRPSSHARSHAVFNIHRGRDQFKAAKNSFKQRKLTCGIQTVLHGVE